MVKAVSDWDPSYILNYVCWEEQSARDKCNSKPGYTDNEDTTCSLTGGYPLPAEVHRHQFIDFVRCFIKALLVYLRCLR